MSWNLSSFWKIQISTDFTTCRPNPKEIKKKRGKKSHCGAGEIELQTILFTWSRASSPLTLNLDLILLIIHLPLQSLFSPTSLILPKQILMNMCFAPRHQQRQWPLNDLKGQWHQESNHLKGVTRQFPCAEGHNSPTPDLVDNKNH